jgi:hypothetical protein
MTLQMSEKTELFIYRKTCLFVSVVFLGHHRSTELKKTKTKTSGQDGWAQRTFMEEGANGRFTSAIFVAIPESSTPFALEKKRCECAVCPGSHFRAKCVYNQILTLFL